MTMCTLMKLTLQGQTILFRALAIAIHETNLAPSDNFGLIKIAKTIGFPLNWESDFLHKKEVGPRTRDSAMLLPPLSPSPRLG